MKGEKRTFSPEGRLSNLQEASKEGQTQTCRKYNIAPSLFSRWKKVSFTGLCGIEACK